MTPRVLVPLDGSAISEQVLPLVERLVRALGSPSVEVLHVVDPQEPLLGSSEEAAPASDIDRAVDQARGYVDRQVARFTKLGLPVSGTVQVGPPASMILERIARGDVDYVYMATHGRSGLARSVMGSVTEEVLRQSPVPVVIMHPSMDQGSTAKEALALRSTSDLVHLFSPHDAVARRCLEIVISRGPKAVPALLDGLAASDAAVRQYAARALGAIRSESALPHLVRSLRDDILEVRWEAAEALAAFGEPGLKATLTMLAEDPVDARVALAARHVFDSAPAQFKTALAPAIQALGAYQSPETVRLAAKEALAIFDARAADA